MKTVILLVALLMSSLSYASDVLNVDEIIKVTGYENTKDYVFLNRPHITVDGKTYRFGASLMTYTEFCKSTLDGSFSFEKVDDGFKSTGTVYLKTDDKSFLYPYTSRSFSYIYCSKEDQKK